METESGGLERRARDVESGLTEGIKSLGSTLDTCARRIDGWNTCGSTVCCEYFCGPSLAAIPKVA